MTIYLKEAQFIPRVGVIAQGDTDLIPEEYISQLRLRNLVEDAHGATETPAPIQAPAPEPAPAQIAIVEPAAEPEKVEEPTPVSELEQVAEELAHVAAELAHNAQ